ncbi:single-strand selective monofunctional uracil DNA glycosylase [Ooceraea biroi]|uniref:Single-strand selective monofunctional uracil DNA glycosylase n=1 Tax=Ooceraea biroi TaxID=2015173 RepID=A0A026W753_OOCBI|nr:single-strand selective monofunctional uracil DNA glycosylase [Ooceraea biroi]EZA51937.1 Single-strand selective monofunctional uracil DNA glycosylase [Ooceraea biroi]
MLRSKRVRAKGDDLPNAKKPKASTVNQKSIVNYLTQARTPLDTMQNKKENDAAEHTSATSTSETGKKRSEQIIPNYVSDKLLSIEKQLSAKVQDITFPSSIPYIYNPLEYAFETHAMYVRKYCTGTKKILFLGMNPGPWGMSQTGVPFGEISMVRDWLEISGAVGHPPKEHPERIVTGFQCPRSEVSGFRLWGLFRQYCGKTENFFRHAYMHNYCPLAFMDGSARNITPAELKGEAQEILHKACDKSLIDISRLLNIEIIVGIGRYAEKRAQIAVQTGKLKIKVVCLRHPSPRVVGNQNWNVIAMQQLSESGLLKYFEKAKDSTV